MHLSAIKFRRVTSRTIAVGARRSFVVFVTAWWLVLALGVPVPTYYSKDLSTPFPCMHRACGCASAAQCWTDCCCTTLAERLAWAKEHGVTPPAFALAAAKQERAASKRTGGCCSEKKACCAKVQDPAFCSSDPLRRTAPRCTSASHPAPAQIDCGTVTPVKKLAGNAVVKPQKPRSPHGSASLLSALKCRGLSNSWLSQGGICVVATAATFTFLQPLLFTLSVRDDVAEIHVIPPPLPPPRALA